MKRTIKFAVVSLSMFALVALSAMPAAAHSPESSSQAAQPTGYSIVTANAEFNEQIDTPTPTNALLRKLAPAKNAGTPWGNFLNGRRPP